MSRAAVWLAPVIVLWAALALIARVPTPAAISVTNALFLVTLLLTYVAALGAAVHASGRRRAAALRAAALTLGIAFALGLLELPAALRLVHWEPVFAHLRGERDEFVFDADLGFRHAPGGRRTGVMRSDIETAWNLPASRTDPITVTYDERGYRNAAALTRADIVLIGDSYVAGYSVSDDQIVSRRLAARLGRRVANLGVAGYGTAQELRVLEREGLTLEPHVVAWFFFEGNDLYNDQEFENLLLASSTARGTASATPDRWRRSFLRNGLAQLRLLLAPLVPASCPDVGVMNAGPHRGEQVLFWPEAAVPWTAFERERWEKAKQTLTRAHTITRERNVRLLLVYVPHKFRVYRDFIDVSPGSALRDWTLWPLPDLFADFCHAEGLACVDLTPRLRDAVRAGGMPHTRTDSHWSSDGHALVAAQVADAVVSRGWVP